MGGEYYFVTDEIKVEENKLYLIEGKHSRNSYLPSNGDIKDGLLKMILYTNLQTVTVNNFPVHSIPVLKLTSTKIKGRILSTDSERVVLLSTILNNALITNQDYQKVIEKEGDSVFIFLDPPYYSATKSALYGKNGNLHKVFDHKRLADTLKKSNHKWLITYDDSEYIKELYSFANITQWNLTYGMRNVDKSGNQIGKELFISNYNLNKNKVEQMNLFDELFST